MSKIVSDDSNFICVSFCLSRVRFAEYNNQITREGSLKKNVFFRHCLKQGGGLHGPMADFFGPFSPFAFLVNKSAYYFKNANVFSVLNSLLWKPLFICAFSVWYFLTFKKEDQPAQIGVRGGGNLGNA